MLLRAIKKHDLSSTTLVGRLIEGWPAGWLAAVATITARWRRLDECCYYWLLSLIFRSTHFHCDAFYQPVYVMAQMFKYQKMHNTSKSY
jgi:hypothetical protein